MGILGIFKNSKQEEFNPYDVVYMLYQIGKEWGKPVLQSELKTYYSDTHDFSTKYEKLISIGWIQPSDKKSGLYGLKVSELKEIAASHNIACTGTKTTIIQALIDNLSDQQLDTLPIPQIIEATPLGQSIIDNNPHIVFLKKHRKNVCCNLFDVHSNFEHNKKLYPNLTFEDLILLSLDEDCFNFADISNINVLDYASEKEYERAIKEYEKDWNKRAKENYRDAKKYLEKLFRDEKKSKAISDKKTTKKSSTNKKAKSVVETPKTDIEIPKTEPEIAADLIRQLLSDFVEPSDLNLISSTTDHGIYFKENLICSISITENGNSIQLPDGTDSMISYSLESLDSISQYQDNLIEIIVRYLS